MMSRLSASMMQKYSLLAESTGMDSTLIRASHLLTLIFLIAMFKPSYQEDQCEVTYALF